MARQLIRAAHAANDKSMTDVDNLSHNIYRWERGAVSPGERYRLYYCRALSIPPAAFGADAAKTGTLVLPSEASRETVKLLNLMNIEYGVSLRAESTSAAVRIARELSDGMTQAGRIATYEFLTEIAKAVRWAAFLDRELLTIPTGRSAVWFAPLWSAWHPAESPNPFRLDACVSRHGARNA
jgi:hypothetical protein